MIASVLCYYIRAVRCLTTRDRHCIPRYGFVKGSLRHLVRNVSRDVVVLGRIHSSCFLPQHCDEEATGILQVWIQSKTRVLRGQLYAIWKQRMLTRQCVRFRSASLPFGKQVAAGPLTLPSVCTDADASTSCISLLKTFHVVRPGRLFKPGNLSATSSSDISAVAWRYLSVVV